MAKDAIPGLILAVTDRGGCIHQQCYGFSSLEAQEPMQPEHRIEFGSIGKSFTCILLLQLAEEGLIDLHRPVDQYLPWFEIQSEFDPITPHHLMTHTAGIINGTDFPADPRYEVWALRETRAVNPPGEHFHYSNVGYKALGLLLERVTGRSYANLIQQRILDPLGMNDTDPAITHSTRKRLATGYQHFYDDRPWRRGDGHAPATWLETDTADGCIAGTAEDLATYLRMLMNGGAGPTGRLLSEESFRLMTTPHAAMPAARLDPDDVDGGGYGYGLYSYSEDGHSFLGHGGGMVGYHTHMLADLTTGFGAVVLINGPGQCAPVTKATLSVIHASEKGSPLPETPAAFDPNRVDNANSYAGKYHSLDGDLDVSARGNTLHATWKGREAQLEPRGEDSFVARHPEFERFLLRFERDEDGEIQRATHGSVHWSAHEQPASDCEYPEEWNAFPGHYRSHNPWLGNFRVVLREGNLYLISPGGYEDAIAPRGDDLYRVGDVQSPEYIRFDTIVEGEAWRAHYSGCDYYRFFTP